MGDHTQYLATLQASGYGTRHINDGMINSGHQITRILMCGGGTKNPYWLRGRHRLRDSMVRSGASLAARPQTKTFDGAKYAVYLQLYHDMLRISASMHAWPKPSPSKPDNPIVPRK